MSALSSRSSVSKKTRVPSAEAPSKNAGKAPLPPDDPVETSAVAPPERSYTSACESVSPAVSRSAVWKNTRAPSAETPSKKAP